MKKSFKIVGSLIKTGKKSAGNTNKMMKKLENGWKSAKIMEKIVENSKKPVKNW